MQWDVIQADIAPDGTKLGRLLDRRDEAPVAV